MRLSWAVAVALCSLLLSAPGLNCQTRQEHNYLWLSLGAGAGVNVSDELEGERSLGGAGYLRVGGAITQQFLVGVEFLAWARRHETETSGDPFTMQRSNASVLLMFYPRDVGGLFLKAGLGGAFIDIEESGMKVREQGTGARAGIGYDIRLGHLYLTPNLDWLFQTFETTQVAKTTNHMLLATLGITWH